MLYLGGNSTKFNSDVPSGVSNSNDNHALVLVSPVIFIAVTVMNLTFERLQTLEFRNVGLHVMSRTQKNGVERFRLFCPFSKTEGL